MNEYINQDIFNSKYLFHGSASPLQTIEPRQLLDTENRNNRRYD